MSEIQTYFCGHMEMSGRFAERPKCGHGCFMFLKPVTISTVTWGGTYNPTIVMRGSNG